MKRSLPIVLATSLVLLGCSAESPRAVAPGQQLPLPVPSQAAPGNVASLASAAPNAPTTVASSTPVSAESPPAAPKLSTPTNELTVQLLHQLRDEPGNVVFSGSSLRTALATAVLVAPSVASDAMLRVLRLEPDRSKMARAAKQEAVEWKRAAGHAELVTANQLWLDKRLQLDATTRKLTQQGYGASTVSLDFVNSPEPSRLLINQWVTRQTHDRIHNLLPEGSIGTGTHLVVTNTVYFKGRWRTAFPTKDTRLGPFQTEHGEVTVPMMHATVKAGYFQNADVQVATLGYKQSDLAMVIVLPRVKHSHVFAQAGPRNSMSTNVNTKGIVKLQPKTDGRALDAIEATLTADQLDTWTQGQMVEELYVTMPKFSFAWGRAVQSELETIGALDMHTPTDVYHNAFVFVDEAGTEAAAATAVIMHPSLPPEPWAFEVDHQFLFFIRNQRTGDLLFAGRVVDPKA